MSTSPAPGVTIHPQERDVREPDAGSAEAAPAEGDHPLLPRHAARRLQDRHQVKHIVCSAEDD